MAFLDDLSTYLVAEGIGVAGTTLFVGEVPPTPDQCVFLIETAGLAAEGQFGSDDLLYEHPRFQVVSRDAKGNYEAARTKAQAAFLALGKVQAETLGTTFYHGLQVINGPFSLGPDKNERPRVAMNVQVHKDI